MMSDRQQSRFQTVLKVREIQERRTQAELHQIKGVHARETEALNDIREVRQGALTDAVRTMKLKATDAQTNRAFLLRLSQDMVKQEKKVEEVEEQEEQKRVELVEKSKSRKIVEHLEHQYHEHQLRENDRKEQRLIDILAQRIRTAGA